MEKLDASAGVDKQGEGTVAKRKKKGPKGPNPLSVKKPSKMRLTGKRGVSSLKNKVCVCVCVCEEGGVSFIYNIRPLSIRTVVLIDS